MDFRSSDSAKVYCCSSGKTLDGPCVVVVSRVLWLHDGRVVVALWCALRRKGLPYEVDLAVAIGFIGVFGVGVR